MKKKLWVREGLGDASEGVEASSTDPPKKKMPPLVQNLKRHRACAKTKDFLRGACEKSDNDQAFGSSDPYLQKGGKDEESSVGKELHPAMSKSFCNKRRSHPGKKKKEKKKKKKKRYQRRLGGGGKKL